MQFLRSKISFSKVPEFGIQHHFALSVSPVLDPTVHTISLRDPEIFPFLRETHPHDTNRVFRLKEKFHFAKFWAQIVLVLRMGGYRMGTLLGTLLLYFGRFLLT